MSSRRNDALITSASPFSLRSVGLALSGGTLLSGGLLHDRAARGIVRFERRAALRSATHSTAFLLDRARGGIALFALYPFAINLLVRGGGREVDPVWRGQR